MRVFASASVAVPMLVALSAVLVTGCGGSGDQTAEGVAGPDTDGGTTHQIGSLVVQTEKTAQFKAEAFESETDCSFIALSGAQINYLASTAMMDRVVYSSNRYGTYNLYVCDFDGRNAYRLTSNNADEIQPRWSPNGDKIVFSRQWPGKPRQIYTINPNGTGVKQLSDTQASRTWPNWSPDGKQIVYQQIVEQGVQDIFSMYSADGAGKRNLTQSPGVNQVNPVWSPDGRTIMFSMNTRGKYRLAEMYEDGTLTQMTDDNANYFAPVYDPRDDWYCYAFTDCYGNEEIVQLSYNFYSDASSRYIRERNITASPYNDAYPSPSSDGRYMAYASDRSGNMDIWIQPLPALWGDQVPSPAWQVTKNRAIDTYPDLGSPTVQTERVLIGRAGTDLFGNDPVWPSAPGAIVAVDSEGYANFVRIGVADNHRASLRLRPIKTSSCSLACIEASAIKIANLREDAGLGEAPKVWNFNAENAGMVLMYLNGSTGKLTTVLPIKDVVFPIAVGSAQAAPYSCSAAGDGSTVTGAFTAVLDADGRNLAPSGATSVTLDADGQVLSVN